MRLALARLAIPGAALLVACGGGGGGKTTTTPIATATTSPAATATWPAATSTVVPAATATAVSATLVPAVPTPSAAPPPSTEIPPPPPPTEPPPVGVTLTVVAPSESFSPRSLSAAAGPVTIVFDNRDTAVAHNIHFFSKAGSIGMTEVMTGPATDVLSLGTLAPGAYSYKCDVHPQTMTGVLTVS